MQKFKKIEAFNELTDNVKKCRLCARMDDSARIFGYSSGTPDAKLMFIGEAPGRLGADSTGIPFHGDKTGENFESLLSFSGISREDVFVTNAVLCNPKDDAGNNATPNDKEILNCSAYLKEQIDIVEPLIIVTLGASALKATSLVEHHSLTLKESIRSSNSWYGRSLIPLYHPGQRAMVHRSMANQRSDYRYVADRVRGMGIKKRIIKGSTNERLAELVKIILTANGRTTYFALHKLVYLLELDYLKEFGGRLTGTYIIRQKDGPYCTDLQVRKLKNAISDLRIIKQGGGLILDIPSAGLFEDHTSQLTLSDAEREFVLAKIDKYGKKSNNDLKKRVYLTRPMRKILKLEKDKRLSMYNAPIKLD